MDRTALHISSRRLSSLARCCGRLLMAAMVLLTVACSRGDVMSEDEMVDFLSEAYLIEGFYAIETGNYSETLTPTIISSYEALLDKQGVTHEKFERSIDYYMHHTDRYEAIHKRVVERLDADVVE